MTHATLPTFDKTVATIIEGISAEAESAGCLDHVLDTYNLSNTTDRRMARIYIQEQRQKQLTTKKTQATVDSHKQPTTTTQEPTKVIEIIVDATGATKQVINHGTAAVDSHKQHTPTTKQEPTTMTVTTTATEVTSVPTYTLTAIADKLLSTATSLGIDDYHIYNGLVELPILKVTGTNDKGYTEYSLLRNKPALYAYAFLIYTGLLGGKDKENVPVMVVGADNKVQGQALVRCSTITALVPASEFIKTKTAKAQAPQAAPSKPKQSAKETFLDAAANAPRPANQDELVQAILDNYFKPMMAVKAAVNRYHELKNLPKLGSKATKADVMMAADKVLLGYGVRIPDAPAKAPKTAKETAAPKAGATPASTVLKAEAKKQGYDISNVNFRSSTERTKLAKALGLV
jgi:hypothetical protein